MARFNGLFLRAVCNTDMRSKLKTSLNSTRVQWLDHYLFGVARSVGLSVCNDHQPGKTSEPIEVRHFGCGLRGRDYVLDDPKREGGLLREMTSRFPRTPPSTVPSGPATGAVECHIKFSQRKISPCRCGLLSKFVNHSLWSSYVIGQTIIFSCCCLFFFFFFFFFPRLISAAADWMSAILPHMVWP